jgi:hypothetical protein
MIFVFGSNLAGRHGKGAALWALKHYGALYGHGEGLQGESYALPTKDEALRTLPLPKIEEHVRRFLAFARENRHLRFFVTPVGTGLAGYQPEDIAPMFRGAPENCSLPDEFKSVLEGASMNEESVKADEVHEDRFKKVMFCLGLLTGALTHDAMLLRLAESLRKRDIKPQDVEMLRDQLAQALEQAGPGAKG